MEGYEGGFLGATWAAASAESSRVTQNSPSSIFLRCRLFGGEGYARGKDVWDCHHPNSRILHFKMRVWLNGLGVLYIVEWRATLYIHLCGSIFLSPAKTVTLRADHSNVSILLKYALNKIASNDSEYIDVKRFGGSPTYPTFEPHSEEEK